MGLCGSTVLGFSKIHPLGNGDFRQRNPLPYKFGARSDKSHRTEKGVSMLSPNFHIENN